MLDDISSKINRINSDDITQMAIEVKLTSLVQTWQAYQKRTQISRVLWEPSASPLALPSPARRVWR